MKRRDFTLGLGVAAWATLGRAASKRSNDPLRVGIDWLLVRSGVGARIEKGFFAHSGLTLFWVPGASATLLEALEAGEIDAALTLAPDIELRLVEQGLAHDRHAVAHVEFLLAGPVQGKAGDPAKLRGTSDASAALALLAAGSLPYLGHSGGSGAHLLEQSLWRAAHAAPAAPWFRALQPGETDELAVAARERRYVLTDRARWSAGGAPGMAALVQGDPRLQLDVQVLRAFRRQHPSGKLFVAWLAGSRGQKLIGGPGVRAAL